MGIPHTSVVSQRRGWRILALIIGAWMFYGLVVATQLDGIAERRGEDMTWASAFKYAYGATWTWVPFSVIAYQLARRFTFGGATVWRSALVVATAITGYIVLKSAYIYGTVGFFGWYDTLPSIPRVLLATARNDLTLACVVVGVAYGFVYYERGVERDRRLVELESKVVSGELNALKAQLNPHFLFNALNSVAELMHEDIEQADRMLVAISDMLRDVLRNHSTQERPLRDELRHVNNYLMIEGIRLGPKLSASMDVDDTSLDIPIPVLSLQPLVENAIVHSIARSREPGWIKVRSWTDEFDLHVTVENSSYTGGARKEGNGIGLRTVEDRLNLLYGGRGHIRRFENGSYRVHVVVPLPSTRALGV